MKIFGVVWLIKLWFSNSNTFNSFYNLRLQLGRQKVETGRIQMPPIISCPQTIMNFVQKLCNIQVSGVCKS